MLREHDLTTPTSISRSTNYCLSTRAHVHLFLVSKLTRQVYGWSESWPLLFGTATFVLRRGDCLLYGVAIYVPYSTRPRTALGEE